MKLLLPRLARHDARIARQPPKTAEPFYLTRAWRDLMGRIIGERGRACERCGRRDCRLFGDHIVELKDGGATLDPANVRLLCGACHSTKTAAARAARQAAPPRHGGPMAGRTA